jgi:hypothetical protein
MKRFALSFVAVLAVAALWAVRAGSTSTQVNLAIQNFITAAVQFGSVATGTSPPTCTPGTAGVFCANEGTAPTSASSVDYVYANSSNHCADVINQTTDIGCVLGAGGTVPNAAMLDGIVTNNAAVQSQVVVSTTEYYVTSSGLKMPATYRTPIAAGATFLWHVTMTKTAAGTGTFQILLKHGTNGTTADTTDATITIGTQTAVADVLDYTLMITFTSTTAYMYTLVPRQQAATITGFGLSYPAVASVFNGTVTGLTTTTASTFWGMSFKATTGTPTITVPLVFGQAFNVN